MGKVVDMQITKKKKILENINASAAKNDISSWRALNP